MQIVREQKKKGRKKEKEVMKIRPKPTHQLKPEPEIPKYWTMHSKIDWKWNRAIKYSISSFSEFEVFFSFFLYE